VTVRIAALLPMRHASVRVPGKNYRPFAGRPLYHHVLDQLLACPRIDRVVIDTDSDFLRSDAAEHFPSVAVLERPGHLRADTVPMNDVLLNTISQVEAEFYLQTHSTNPLLRARTIEDAIGQFLESYPVHDSLFSVTRLQSRLWDQLVRPVNHNPALLLRTQDLPPIYEENSCLYLFTGDTLRRRHNRIGERPLLFEIERLEAWDIDEELDFRVGEFLYRARAEAGGSSDAAGPPAG
jgi:CMP-N-acetylneuraminic acid synthetase